MVASCRLWSLPWYDLSKRPPSRCSTFRYENEVAFPFIMMKSMRLVLYRWATAVSG